MKDTQTYEHENFRHFTETTVGTIKEVRDTLFDMTPFNWQDRHVNYSMKEIMRKYARPGSLLIVETQDGEEIVCFGRRFTREERKALPGQQVEHRLDYQFFNDEHSRNRQESQLYTLNSLDRVDPVTESVWLRR